MSVLPRAALEYPQPRPGAATSRGCEVLATGTGLSENDEALVWTAPARGASLRSHQGSHENALPAQTYREGDFVATLMAA